MKVDVPGPGTLTVLVTAWDDNLSHAKLTPQAAHLHPAPKRFVFARAHLTVGKAGALLLRLTPTKLGHWLVRHHTYRVTLRIRIAYTPVGGHSTILTRYHIHLAPRHRAHKPTGYANRDKGPRHAGLRTHMA